MANDNVCSAGAATRDVSNEPASPLQDCSDVIHISVFFDGTGNNKDVDEATKKWSKPARIWRAARVFADTNLNAYTAVRLNANRRDESQALARSSGQFCLVPT
jgi:hypothetical protein